MLKKMTPAERKKVNPRAVFFAGKAAPACECRTLSSFFFDHRDWYLLMVSVRLHCQAREPFLLGRKHPDFLTSFFAS